METLLGEGRSVRFRAAGNSMHPTIKQGDTLIIEPCRPANLSRGDIVLFKQDSRLVAHRLVGIELNPGADAASAIRTPDPTLVGETQRLKSCCSQDALPAPSSRGRRTARAPEAHSRTERRELRFVLRGDFRTTPDPPVPASQILGKVVAIERNQKIRSPYGYAKQLYARSYRLSSRIKSVLLTWPFR